jgi:hypothetical protein
MMTMTSTFWTTIERIPGHTTDTREWQNALVDCWDAAKNYLSKMSKFAERIDCPWPGGENCPRLVVRHQDGSFRAVCGDPKALCESLDITRGEIQIRELDRRKLFTDIAIALKLDVTEVPVRHVSPLHVGDHHISAGRTFPVFAALSSPRAPLGKADLLDLDRRKLPFILLVTSLRAIEHDVVVFLGARGGRVLTYAECLNFAAAPGKGFAPVASLADLFAPEISALTNTDDSPESPVMTLPVNTRWSDLRFAFREEAVLNVSYLGQKPVRLEPDQIGMRDDRNGKPNRQWRLLLACAALDGALPRSFPVSTIKGRRPASHILRILDEFKRGYDKQRQTLAATLREKFGIEDDPFLVRDDCFEAQFLVDAQGLRQGQSDQRQRNFVDDD